MSKNKNTVSEMSRVELQRAANGSDKNPDTAKAQARLGALQAKDAELKARAEKVK